MTDIIGDTELAPAVTYGGVQDRPGDVNHPDNLGQIPNSTDPSAGTLAPAPEPYED